MKTAWIRRVTALFVKSDPEYESFLRQHEAKSRKEILFYLSCAVLPMTWRSASVRRNIT
ncbi:hypothetical protein ACFQ3W_09940 [Paenibacillus puldeungensis]|uniref:Uncharacterized protein n=1 Tax=Paenibacillus puldeungensis TaxID=696536 RepID=A0ABW3RWD8_9BACL